MWIHPAYTWWSLFRVVEYDSHFHNCVCPCAKLTTPDSIVFVGSNEPNTEYFYASRCGAMHRNFKLHLGESPWWPGTLIARKGKLPALFKASSGSPQAKSLQPSPHKRNHRNSRYRYRKFPGERWFRQRGKERKSAKSKGRI